MLTGHAPGSERHRDSNRITGRRQTLLDATAAQIGSSKVTGIAGDISRTEDIARIFDSIRAHTDELPVVFANAGGGSLSLLGSITEEQFDKTFNMNVKGVVFTVQHPLPFLRAGASLTLNASTTSIKGTAAFSTYRGSKAAVRNSPEAGSSIQRPATSAST